MDTLTTNSIKIVKLPRRDPSTSKPAYKNKLSGAGNESDILKIQLALHAPLEDLHSLAPIFNARHET
jgi:hypothetical protein